MAPNVRDLLTVCVGELLLDSLLRLSDLFDAVAPLQACQKLNLSHLVHFSEKRMSFSPVSLQQQQNLFSSLSVRLLLSLLPAPLTDMCPNCHLLVFFLKKRICFCSGWKMIVIHQKAGSN